MTKTLINPDTLYDASAFGMSQAVIDNSSGLVFVSGQVAWDQQYVVMHDTLAGQFQAALHNLQAALVAAGTDVAGLLHLRIYVRGELEEHMATVGPMLASFLGDSRPAVTGIGVASLAAKALLVEIEAVARRHAAQ